MTAGRLVARDVALLAAIEAGRDDRDHDLVAEPLVEARPEDDVGLRVGRGADLLGRLGHLEQAEARRAGDVEQDALGAGDVDLEERAGDRHPGGLDGAVLALGAADPHESRAGVAHDRANVGEIEIDESWHGDDVADALDALAEDVVDDAEGIEDAGVLLDDVLEPVVGDRDEGVDLRLELLGRLLRDELALGALEGERLGHDADRQRTGLLGELGHDRRRARAGPAAEPGGDEDHVRVGERLGDLLRVLFRRALADRGVAAGSETAGDLVADPDLVRGVGLEERLRVGVEAMNSTPIISARIIRLTALLPPPPTPMTRISAKFSESERNGIGLSSATLDGVCARR